MKNSLRLIMCVFVISIFDVQASRADPAHDLLQHIWETYHSLNSYHSKSSFSSFLLKSGKPVKSQSSQIEFWYQKPNLIRLDFTQPSGTALLTCDGSHIYVYKADMQKYSVDKAGPTLVSNLPKMARRAGIMASLDPLGLIAMKALPDTFTMLKIGKHIMFNGKHVTMLLGSTRTLPQKIHLSKSEVIAVPGVKRYWKWWIEDGTNLILRLESLTPPVPVKVKVQNGNRLVFKTVKMKTLVRMMIYELTPNAVIPDSTFKFKAPDGSSEMKEINGTSSK